MSLLTDASLLLTPNAYKEGKLYSVIPSNGNGDFTATRATTATRVNSAGLVDLVPYNLASWSEMFSNAAWIKTASSITANTTTAPDGALTADTFTGDGTNNQHQLVQGVNLTNAVSYTLSVYAKKNTNDFLQLYGSGLSFGANVWANFDLNLGIVGSLGTSATSSIQSVGNGWYRCEISFTSASTASNNFIFHLITSATSARGQSNTLNTSVFVWGAQLVEGTSARDYLRTETRLNIPRVDYSLGSCPNILLEPQRTNLNLYSEDLTNAYWSKFQSSVTGNAAISPSGTLTADKIVEDTTTNAHSVFIGGLILSIGQSLTRSVYLKADGRSWAVLAIAESGVFHRAYFNLSNGTIGNVGAGVTASIEPAANGYYKCIITRVLTTTNPSSFAIELASANGTNSYLGNGTSGVFVWGAQIEVGAYATSYIPTTTASVTRNADTITRNNIFTNGLITAAGGTWFVELRNNVQLIADNATLGLWLGTSSSINTSNGTLYFRQGGGNRRTEVWKYTGGVGASIYQTTANTCKIAIKWNGSTADIFENGIKVVSATSFAHNNMEFLNNNTGRNTFINEMALFPTPLTDAQCIALTQ